MFQHQRSLDKEISIIRIHEQTYSQLLKEIPQPPTQLYVRGNIQLLNAPRLISIVGSRKGTSYGKHVVKDAVQELVRADFVTVSGLALGIDGIVHKETLDAHGKTIGVLGSSVDYHEIAPSSHQYLAKEIIAHNGLLVSEYPPGSPVYPSNFPARNRIIAGLSHATLIVEAGENSGALITARLALDSNREVFAVPGSIYEPLSVGTNNLIQRGATPWLSCATLFDALEYLLPTHDQPSSSRELYEQTPDHTLTENECKILCCFSESSLTVDEIIDQLDAPAHEVIALISTLMIKGAIVDMGGQRYALSYSR